MMVPTYPEDGSRALKVYQHQHPMVVRVGHKAPIVSSEFKEQLSRDCVGRLAIRLWDLHSR